MQNRSEQILFVLEMMIQSAASHSGPSHNLLSCRVSVSALGEEPARNFQEDGAGGGGIFSLAALDCHTFNKLHTHSMYVSPCFSNGG
jgi:hypothetical protein